MSLNFIPVVLAGGTGTRLWPLSRSEYPKQFLPLCGERSLMQESLLRVSGVTDSPPILMCSENHRFLTAEQLQQLSISNATIILEPAARNTAPAIAVAAWKILQQNNDSIAVVMPADHLISDNVAFEEALEPAVELAKNGQLVTLGIKPNKPETGYGYIEVQRDSLNAQGVAMDVQKFIEKPDLATAESFLSAGNYYWNAGIFIFKPSVFLNSLESLQPNIHLLTKSALENATLDLDFVRLAKESYLDCEDISVDYAVMEKSDNVSVIPFNSSWSDIGSWDSLHQAMELDKDGNASVGRVISSQSKNTFVHASTRTVVTHGVENLSVVETSDAVLVMDNASAQSIKGVVEGVKSSNVELVKNHTTVYRPWGHYESLSLNSRFQVKRICVKPGAKLSLQKHFHRSEHWVVVNGTAVVTIDDQEIMLTENESTYIPLGAMHRLFNPGKIPLELIEVQSGAYLGEDDIVRVGDEYGRAE